MVQNNTIVFIGFQEQDNLGIGYMAAILLEEGFSVRIIDFRKGNQLILEELQKLNPLVVGFSVIFQHYLVEFSDLISFLRKEGVTCHFCAGGHYPSLRPVDLFSEVPELDSIVLFEGEWTFLELVSLIASQSDWKQIRGIAYRENGSVFINSLRPLEKDLDNFSPPVRPPLREYAFGKKFATILAGRGCVHNCTFCSIRRFYEQPPGPVKRVRLPSYVAKEMELLHKEQSCSVFMFQDDDFPVVYEKKKKWITEFCDSLKISGLSDKILWKINCRPDEVDYDLFSLMKQHGLFLVYLGIESGTNAGLKLMNKRIDVSVNHKAVQILNDLGILYDYGFMLFDPESTFETVEENLAFLGQISRDGSSPITFCKMLPYAETTIEKMLKKEGRLNGDSGYLDYHFHDPRLDGLYEFMALCFSDWIGDHQGVLNLARWVRYYVAVYRKYLPVTAQLRKLEAKTTGLIAKSNLSFLEYAGKMVEIFKLNPADSLEDEKLLLKKEVFERHKKYCSQLVKLIDQIQALSRTAGQMADVL